MPVFFEFCIHEENNKSLLQRLKLCRAHVFASRVVICGLMRSNSARNQWLISLFRFFVSESVFYQRRFRALIDFYDTKHFFSTDTASRSAAPPPMAFLEAFLQPAKLFMAGCTIQLKTEVHCFITLAFIFSDAIYFRTIC